MARPLHLLCCVGLTPAHLGGDTPHLAALAGRGSCAPLAGVVPAVTCTAQATMLTGAPPSGHGIVANGWFFRDLGEVWLWRQSQGLVQAEHCWQRIRRQRPLKVLKHFWWYAMNGDVDATVTPRPVYHHDGRKSPDCYAQPDGLKQALVERHGSFPLFSFWGPTAGIASTRWIADSFITAVDRERPDLALCYLPHLDYDLQRFGPRGQHLARNLRQLDAEAGKLIDHARACGAEIAVVSEYGIEAAEAAAFPNQALRREGLLRPVANAAGELIDFGASNAFAVCDHQIAHVYCKDDALAARAAQILARLPGVERALLGNQRRELGLDHPRSGEVVLLARPGWWFAPDWWLDAANAPDFARCVEIHRKPGYDPRELLFDPAGGRRRAAWALARKLLGLRYVMDAIPLDTALVKGTHGRPPARPEDGPLLIAGSPGWAPAEPRMAEVAGLIERHFLSG